MKIEHKDQLGREAAIGDIISRNDYIEIIHTMTESKINGNRQTSFLIINTEIEQNELGLKKRDDLRNKYGGAIARGRRNMETLVTAPPKCYHIFILNQDETKVENFEKPVIVVAVPATFDDKTGKGLRKGMDRLTEAYPEHFVSDPNRRWPETFYPVNMTRRSMYLPKSGVGNALTYVPYNKKDLYEYVNNELSLYVNDTVGAPNKRFFNEKLLEKMGLSTPMDWSNLEIKMTKEEFHNWCVQNDIRMVSYS